jgi:hypothetical protein
MTVAAGSSSTARATATAAIFAPRTVGAALSIGRMAAILRRSGTAITEGLKHGMSANMCTSSWRRVVRNAGAWTRVGRTLFVGGQCVAGTSSRATSSLGYSTAGWCFAACIALARSRDGLVECLGRRLWFAIGVEFRVVACVREVSSRACLEGLRGQDSYLTGQRGSICTARSVNHRSDAKQKGKIAPWKRCRPWWQTSVSARGAEDDWGVNPR